jgi:hypothetical protein
MSNNHPYKIIPDRITKLASYQIFVFGINTEGKHGQSNPARSPTIPSHATLRTTAIVFSHLQRLEQSLQWLLHHLI